VNKSKFLELVKHPEFINEQDLGKLETLASEHPYSQIVHVLNVKAKSTHDKPNFEKALHLAATYVYDRELLRTLIEGEIDATEAAPVPEVVADTAFDAQEQEEVSDFEWIKEIKDDDVDPAKTEELRSHDPSSIVTEVASEITETSDSVEESTPETVSEEPTEETKNKDSSPEEVSEAVTAEEPVTPEETDQNHIEPESEAVPPDTTETVTAELKEISDSLQELADEETPAPVSPEETTEEINSEDTSTQKDTVDTVDPVKTSDEEALNLEIEAGSIHAELMENLNQLQESKQQLEETTDIDQYPQNRREQIEIIDNFIKNSPVLSKPNLSADSEAETQDDLSKKSTKLSDELISENLAKIYLKQGKRKDAEKIYKKLIRKFPQKKGYFADQIEKTKKKK
jgi:hypothetical protein